MSKLNFIVDVDNPAFKPEVHPITAHSRIAGVYKFRPPYLKDFFRQAANRLGLIKTDKLLDLCCGRGELSAGFSEYVNHINAVDGSCEMLQNSIPSNNVKYYLMDVNGEQLIFAEKADCLLVGSAVHWIKSKNLSELIISNLSLTGKVFISDTLFRFDGQPYAEVLRNLNMKYGRADGGIDLWGRDKLNACGFFQSDQIRMIANVKFDIDFLYKNQLSYAYKNFYKILSSEENKYKKEFYDVLLPFCSDGRLSATLVNWAVIYSPKSNGI